MSGLYYFDHDELSYINLAVLLKDYSTELYTNDMPAVHAVTESINENVCLLSVIAIDNDTLKNHILFPEINAVQRFTEHNQRGLMVSSFYSFASTAYLSLFGLH